MDAIGTHRAYARPKRDKPTDIEGLLSQLATIGQGQRVSVGQLLDAIGRRAFAPFLLFISLLGFTPIGVVPGVPTVLAALIILIAGQLALGHPRIWLPRTVLSVSVSRARLERTVKRLKPFGRGVDKVIRPRLVVLTEPPFSSVMAVVCVLLALTVPPLELIPLVDIPLWAAMVAFSLALFAHDGALALVAIALTTLGITLSVSALL